MAKLHVFDSCVVAVALCVVVVARRQSVEDANETLSNMLEFSQDSIEQLIEAQTITVDYNLTLSTSMGFSYDCWLVVTCADRFVGDVIENIETPVACTGTTYGNFTVLAKFIGITSLSFRVYSSESDTIYSDNGYRVSVMRQPRIIDVAFNYIVAIFVIVTMIGFGASIDIAVVKEIVKRPIAPAIGAFCQLVVMPLVSFGLACAVTVGTSWKLGLLTVGSCPGGGLSNIFTFLLDGDITLSIAMTLLNTLLTLGTMPMWLAVLGKNFTRGTNLRIPFVSIIVGLSYMLGPVLLGFGIRVFRPKWAVVITYVLKPVCVVLIISGFAVGIYSNLYVFYIVTPIITTVAFLLPWAGFVFDAGILESSLNGDGLHDGPRTAGDQSYNAAKR
ncbi:PREDICTED: sodium/bile acid cotransporter-like, partial [Priapulus caudatus]|uniref:Sodium/bile acid cotransporter-like n=1 Tax=Priapulus caudatus TaxID=37621 RepID=A0ABM1DVI9_PRICU